MIKKSFMNILNYGADPWSIGDIGILDNNQLANGPGISQRAAAARTQTVWRWLVTLE